MASRLEGIWVKIGHSSTLRIGRIRSDGTVAVQWCNRTSQIAQTTNGTSIKINWESVAGHREWNQRNENFSNFVLQQNDTLLEKGHHSWRRVQNFHSHQDIEHFKEHGYLILRKAIPPKMVKRARRAILSDIKNHYVGATRDPDGYQRMAAQTFATALREDDGGLLSDLMSCSVMGQAAEALVGQIVLLHGSKEYLRKALAMRVQKHYQNPETNVCSNTIFLQRIFLLPLAWKY